MGAILDLDRWVDWISSDHPDIENQLDQIDSENILDFYLDDSSNLEYHLCVDKLKK